MRTLQWFIVWVFISSVGCESALRLITERLETQRKLILHHEIYQINRLIISPGGSTYLIGPKDVTVKTVFFNKGKFCEFEDNSEQKDIRSPGTMLEATAIFQNSALFVYESLQTHFAPRIRIGKTRRFVNSGSMFFHVGGIERPDFPGAMSLLTKRRADPDVIILASKRFINEGQIIFSGYKSHILLAVMDVSAQLQNGMKNKGTITLYHSFLDIRGKVWDNGCIVILGMSVLVLSNPNEFSQNQVIFMKSGGSGAKIEILLGDNEPNFHLSILNMNTNSEIRFSDELTLSEESLKGKFVFYKGSKESTGTIYLKDLEVMDAIFNGMTLRVRKTIRVWHPRFCNLKALNVQIEASLLRSQVTSKDSGPQSFITTTWRVYRPQMADP